MIPIEQKENNNMFNIIVNVQHRNGLKNDFKHLLKHLFKGGTLICQKYNSQISKNFEKSPNQGNQN